MKKYILISLMIILSSFCFAQTDEDLEQSMEDAQNQLLQILDDGILTDSQGRKVDFKNAVIIMTSNVGARLINEEKATFGFTANENSHSEEKIKEAVMGELKNTFRPEFLNRIDDIIVFSRLKEDDIKEIAKRLLKGLEKRMEVLEIGITFDESVVDYISKAGYDKIYGARPLKRAIQTKIEDVLSEKILEKSIEKNNTYVCSMENDELKVQS